MHQKLQKVEMVTNQGVWYITLKTYSQDFCDFIKKSKQIVQYRKKLL